MKRNGKIVSKENQLIRQLARMVDKKDIFSVHKPDVHGWDDGKIYFWDGEKENCVSDYPELIDAITKICQVYFRFKQQKIERAKPGLAKLPKGRIPARAKKRR